MSFAKQLIRAIRMRPHDDGGTSAPWTRLPEWPALRVALDDQRHYRLARMLDALHTDEPGAWALAIQGLARAHSDDLRLDWWVEAASHRAEPWVARALYTLGKLAGGSGRGQPGLTPTALMQYFRRLEAIEADLFESAARLPASAEPWAWLLYAGQLGGLDDDALAVRFAQAHRREPGHFLSHMLRLSGEADGGPAALDFAHRTSDASPHGSPLHALVPQAWIECWSWWTYSGSAQEATRRLTASAARAEIRAAFSRHTSQADPWRSPLRLGLFAAAFYLLGEREPALKALTDMGPSVYAYPWSYLATRPGDLLGSGHVVQRIRKELEVLPA